MSEIESQPIGLLATGSELIHGDILNTNGQHISQQLKDLGFQVGMHVLVSDNEAEIASALEFLLQQHQTIIITGGLGPTSDDRTRYALSHTINKPLIFDEPSWEHIVKRLQKFAIAIHASNRQQAFFPEGAQIFPNPHGTAAGCVVIWQQKCIYLLPGPPHECLPMFQIHVIPHLSQHKPRHDLLNFKWLLFGVIEADIAAELDAIVKSYPATTGYRLRYPYLEFKLQTQNHPQIEQMLATIEQCLEKHWFTKNNVTAAEAFATLMQNFSEKIIIHDQATAGLLEATVVNPENRRQLIFTHMQSHTIPADYIQITINGLKDYWEKTEATFTDLEIAFAFQQQQTNITAKLPNRPNYAQRYAVEYICQQILLYLNQ